MIFIQGGIIVGNHNTWAKSYNKGLFAFKKISISIIIPIILLALLAWFLVKKQNHSYLFTGSIMLSLSAIIFGIALWIDIYDKAKGACLTFSGVLYTLVLFPIIMSIDFPNRICPIANIDYFSLVNGDTMVTTYYALSVISVIGITYIVTSIVRKNKIFMLLPLAASFITLIPQSIISEEKMGYIVFGIVFIGQLLICVLPKREYVGIKKHNKNYSSSSSGGSSSGTYSGGYSGYTPPKSERTFTQGGSTGCGIGGSFCGCGNGR